MQVGFVGLGSMGFGMAGSLLRSGLVLTVHNRTAARAAPLVESGARLAQSLEDLSGVSVLCTMLSDDTSVEAVCLQGEELALPLAPRSIHLSHSTISPACAVRLANAHRARGVHYVSAPVLGRPDRAAAGALSIIAAGPAEAIETSGPVLDAMSARVFNMGPEPAMANYAKLGMNYMLACALEAMAESFAMARKSGIAPDAFLELVTGSIFNAPAYTVYAPLVAHEVCPTPGFRTTLGLKDVTLAVESAAAIGAELPMAEAICQRLRAAMSSGFADRDWASLAIVAARAANLPPHP